MCDSCVKWCASKLATSGPTGRYIRGIGWVGAPRGKRLPKRAVETSAFLAMVHRMVRRAGVRVADADEIELGELAAVERTLTEALQTAVDGMRDRGMSWEWIGRGLGVKKSAAHERFGR